MFQALRRIGSTLSLLILECSAAVVATAIGWAWLGAALSWSEILFAGMILAGIICGLSPGPIPSLARPVVFAGTAFALLGSCFQAISFNLSKKAFLLLEQSGGQLDQLTAAYQRLVGGAAVALLLYALGWCLSNKQKPLPPPATKTPFPTPVWVVGNALFGPVLGVSCMLWAIRLVDNPGIVQAVAATATLLTVPLAYRLEGARPGKRYYAGCLIALMGIFLLVV
jgi:drug/metabolite transporter (DMT)-like permease